jgi:preprotein translocase subunit SecE
MSRAIRRQQGQSGAQQDGGGGGGRLRPFGPKQSRQTRGNRPSQPQRKRFRLGLPNWITEIWSELRKVTWPTRDETAYLTMVVIIVAVIVGVALGAIDVAFNELVDRLLFN